jgi:carboxylesterase
MNPDDFAYLFRGKIVQPVSQQDARAMLPIDKTLSTNTDHALLLLHGFASSPAVFRVMLPLLQGYDRIVCPVLPGHADSLQQFGKVTAEQWRQSAQQHCAALLETYTKVSVLGLSLGGLLALELSTLFPVHHLFLLAPALKLSYSARLALMGAYLLRGLGIRHLPNFGGGDLCNPTHPELGFRQFPLSTVIEILTLFLKPSYPEPQCKTDLFLGRYDKVIDSKTVAKHYAHTPHLTLHWLPHSAHILPLDGDVAMLVQCINQNMYS